MFVGNLVRKWPREKYEYGNMSGYGRHVNRGKREGGMDAREHKWVKGEGGMDKGDKRIQLKSRNIRRRREWNERLILKNRGMV